MKKRKLRKPYFKKGRSLVKNLIKTLERQDFDRQLSETAHHFGMSKREVLENILGR